MAEPSAGYLSIPVTVTSASQGVFNEAGLDIDFRVESDTNEYGLYLDGTDGAVGIGTSTPYAESLHLYSGASGRTDFNADADNLIIESDTAVGLTLATSSPNIASIYFANENNQSPGKIQYDNQFSYMRMYSNWKEFLRAVEAETVINEIGYDKDFRVESATNTHALFVQGSDGAVGIGQPAPNVPLVVGSQNPIITSDGEVASFYSGAGTSVSILTDSDTADTGARLRFLERSVNKFGLEIYYDSATNQTAFTHYSNSVALNEFRFRANAAIFNEDGNDVDFRVESDTNTHALFVDAGTSRVGINESAPSGFLHINNPSTPNGVAASYPVNGDEFIIEGANNTGMTILGGNIAGAHIYLGNQAGSSATIKYDNAVDELRLSADTATDPNTQLKIKQGIQIGAPTGGYKGTGTINAVGLHGGRLEVSGTASTETVINEDGNDHDFRVESDTNTHALFVQGSDGRVGINTSSPGGPLEVGVTAGTSGPASGFRVISEDGGGWALFPATAVANPTWTANVNSGESHAWSAGGSAFTKMTLTNGLYMSGATGGDKGVGTINATAVYDDNTLLTDFVLDQAVDGEIDYEFYDSLELGGQAAREWDPRNLDIDWYSAQWRERRSLPAFMAKEERFDADGNEVRDSIGKLVQGLQQELETAHVHIAQLNERLKELEAKL